MSLPFISVVVPTYERPDALRRCVRALRLQDYPRDRYEVIVVDDGSTTDLTRAVHGTSHGAQTNGQAQSVTLLRQANAGPAAARNRGAANAQGSYLAFTDDDCAPARGWLQGLSRALSARPRAVVGGRTINAFPANPYAEATQLLITYLSAHSAEQGMPSFFATNNLALSTDDFHAVGGFDTRFPLAAGEDRDFCDRCQLHGLAFRYVPDAHLYHHHNLTLPSYLRQHYNYGRGAYRVWQKRQARHETVEQGDWTRFIAGLLALPFHHAPASKAVLYSTLLGVAQGATAAGYWAERTASERASSDAPSEGSASGSATADESAPGTASSRPSASGT